MSDANPDLRGFPLTKETKFPPDSNRVPTVHAEGANGAASARVANGASAVNSERRQQLSA